MKLLRRTSTTIISRCRTIDVTARTFPLCGDDPNFLLYPPKRQPGARLLKTATKETDFARQLGLAIDLEGRQTWDVVYKGGPWASHLRLERHSSPGISFIQVEDNPLPNFGFYQGFDYIR